MQHHIRECESYREYSAVGNPPLRGVYTGHKQASRAVSQQFIRKCSMISGTMWTHGGLDIRTVTLEVSSREKINRRFLRAFDEESKGEFISFESPELLFKVISGKRWELIKIMTGAGPMTIREAARRMERDVKGVHGDVQALLKAGIFQKT